jgi:hypothetical protein
LKKTMLGEAALRPDVPERDEEAARPPRMRPNLKLPLPAFGRIRVKAQPHENLDQEAPTTSDYLLLS